MRLAGLAMLVLALMATVFFMRPRPGVSPSPPRPDRVPSTAPRPEALRPPELTRDPFRYGQGRSMSPAPTARVEPFPVPPPTTLTAAFPIRLIGFVRGATLRAALVVDGEVILAAAGEKPFGYEILGVDEDSGVKIRDHSGDTFTLPPP